MPLPFLKNQKEGGAAGPVETVTRTPDDEGDMDLLDAVAEDLLAAVKAGDKALLKSALESFIAHIQTQDEAQDLAAFGD